MTKNKPRAKIDSEYSKNLRYPDINDYLKDTYYSANTSNFLDNQSRTQLVLRQQDAQLDLITPVIAGTTREYLLNSYVFYGYNPELESVEYCVLKIDYLDESIVFQKEYRRDENEAVLDPDRLQVITRNTIDPSIGRVVNFGIFISKRTILQILQAIFNRNAREAFKYYLADATPDAVVDAEGEPVYDAERLRRFVDKQIYRLKIPVDIEVYYYESDLPGAIIEAELSFGSVAQSLLSQIRPKSLSITLNNYTTMPYRDYRFFRLSSNTNIPVEVLLRAKVDGSSTIYESVRLRRSQQAVDLNLQASMHALAANFGYRVTYPKLDLRVTGFKVTGTDGIIARSVDIPDIEFGKNNESKSLTILNYFIGHEPVFTAGSSSEDKTKPFSIRIRFSAAEAIDVTKPYKFQLEFTDSLRVPEQYLLYAGDVNGTLPSSTEYDTKVSGVYSFGYKAGVSSDLSSISMVSVKIKNTQEDMVSSIDHNYRTTLRKTSDGFYELALVWPSTAVNLRGFTLAAELSKISLKITDYFQQALFTGSMDKFSEDIYPTRGLNPFYVKDVTVLSWYPKYRDLFINNKLAVPVLPFVNLTRFSNFNTYSQSSAPLKFYKASSPDGTLRLQYTIRLYCRGYMAPNAQRNYFMPDVFYPLTAIVAASYRVGNSTKYGPILEGNKVLKRLDKNIKYSFDPNTNRIEVFFSKAKIIEWLRYLLNAPERAKRRFYLLINTSASNPYTNQYISNKPLVSTVIMYEV